MPKKNKLQKLIETFRAAIKSKNERITTLEFQAKNAVKEDAIIFKMPPIVLPEKMTISNLPDIQKVEISNPAAPLPDVLKVQVTNPQKDINFPAVQKVELLNPEKSEKVSEWLPDVLAHMTKSIIAQTVKLIETGMTVRLSDEDRMHPMPVILVDRKGRLVDNQPQQTFIPMAMGGGSVTKPPTTIASGRKTIATPGTAQQLVTVATLCRKIIVTAPASNGGSIYIGGSNASAVAGSEIGLLLNPTGSVEIDIDDVSKVWIDATAAGEGITYTYVR